MFRTILALIVLCLCAAVGYLIRTFPIDVIIDMPHAVVRIGMVTWLLISFVVSWLLLLVLRLLPLLWNAPELCSGMAHKRKRNKAQRLLQRGMAEMISGHYVQAEKCLVRGGDLAEEIGQSPVVYFENAARAAEHLQQTRRRDQHLLKARQWAHSEGQSFANRLNEAEMAQSRGENERALKVLEKLREEEPNNIKVLRLLDTTYDQLGAWDAAWKNLSALAPYVDAEHLGAKQLRYAEGILNTCKLDADQDHFTQVWQSFPEAVRGVRHLQILYAGNLAECGFDRTAEAFLAAEIRENPELDLIQVYSQVLGDAPAQLENMKRWEAHFPGSPLFAYAKALVAFRAKDYETAARACEESLRQNPTPAAFGLWAQILEATNQKEAALGAYRESVTRSLPRALSGELLPAPDAPQ